MRIYGEAASQELFRLAWLAFSSSRSRVFSSVSSFFTMLLFFVVSSALLAFLLPLPSCLWTARAKGRDSTSAHIKSKGFARLCFANRCNTKEHRASSIS